MDRCVRYIFVCVLVLIPMSMSCMVRYHDPHRANEENLLNHNDPNNPVVYLGSFGNTYHTEDCPYLRLEKYPIRLKDAQRFYKPCLKCKPIE